MMYARVHRFVKPLAPWSSERSASLAFTVGLAGFLP
jgi:hypothetical protein